MIRAVGQDVDGIDTVFNTFNLTVDAHGSCTDIGYRQMDILRIHTGRIDQRVIKKITFRKNHSHNHRAAHQQYGSADDCRDQKGFLPRPNRFRLLSFKIIFRFLDVFAVDKAHAA